MRAGRLSVLVVLLLLVVVATSSSPRGEEQAVPGARKPANASPPAEVSATLPRSAAVRAQAGDLVRLRVRAREAGKAEIPELGISWPYGGGIAGEVEFLAPRPGRFPILRRDGGEDLGTLVVAGPG